MDTMGCLGGFVCGLLSSWMMLPKTNDSKCQRNLTIIGGLLTVTWFILWTVLFATGTAPLKFWYYEGAPDYV
jgi:hypothetical protein